MMTEDKTEVPRYGRVMELTGQPQYPRLRIRRKTPISQSKMESSREHLTLTSGLHVHRRAQVIVHVHTQTERDRESEWKA